MNISSLLNNDITQDDYLRYKNATLLLKKLPNEIGGLIVKKNDINIIIINNCLDLDQQKKAFLHEIIHLELNHTYKYKIISNDRSIFEQEVDNYLKELNFD